MGGKASSNSQSFESFVKENQCDFINELSHQNKKNKIVFNVLRWFKKKGKNFLKIKKFNNIFLSADE